MNAPIKLGDLHSDHWPAVAEIYRQGIATGDVGLREALGKLAGRWRDVLLLERRSRRVAVDEKL